MMNNDQDSIGICAIYDACFSLYPDQPTPPQVTALQKFWLGGPDPLDYISMYENPGLNVLNDQNSSSFSHWHYVTYGLSDLYGDSRLHNQQIDDGPSGFGFELTFRLRKHNELKPPLWPAMILQSLARYLFRSQAKFAPGDHIPWGKPLEDICSSQSESGFEKCDSKIVNMLIASDPQLERINTKHGWVDFLQIVGACDEEIMLSRKGSGVETLNLMKKYELTGGSLLVTDTRRGESLLDVDNDIDLSIRKCEEGSTMSGVTTEIGWSCKNSNIDESNDDIDVVGDEETKKSTIDNNYEPDNGSPFYGITISPSTLELFPPRYMDKIHLKISKDAAEIMGFVVAYRLRFGRHFTFLHCRSDNAVTFVTENITGIFVNDEKRFGFRGTWLQIFVNSDWMKELEDKFSKLSKINEDQLPLHLDFPSYNVSISIHHSKNVDLF